ncbi:DUF2293 domain-containing protein [Mycobacterium sp. GA-2829]|uniref:DUF2293 domain-containing protein n=1 Tax=Mycobacterium sp. GA-2829 TaxID=1772283 RepID=UPI0007401860|nr:DUF2293 domain-containing protein [Mycobacterium sp. GA-2829]KUI39236.1 hypothetical protein AU194_14485 [Mycobacterium sp. GA-2829]
MAKVARLSKTVLSTEHAWECDECSAAGDFFLKGKERGVCLWCAGLGHLEFLPCGDATLTRHARKASRMSAVVMQMNLRRMRHERRGILVEPAAVEFAARECLADSDFRASLSDRLAQPQAEATAVIAEHFPGCPPDRAAAIALHAVALSLRPRRAAPEMDGDAVRAAVEASVRHVDTDFDELLMAGVDREAALTAVGARVEGVLSAWRDGFAALDA